MNNYPLPKEKWQHYKGGQYEIICMSNHTETNEPLVVYKSLSFGSIYARPFSEWYDEIKVEGSKFGTTRFVKIG